MADLDLYGVAFDKLFTIERSDGFAESYQAKVRLVPGPSPLVYVELVERPIGRLKGSSQVNYIGQTKHGLANRYWRIGKDLAWAPNAAYYDHALNHYGSVTVFQHICATPDEAVALECRLLVAYLHDHLELPPKNEHRPKGAVELLEALYRERVKK